MTGDPYFGLTVARFIQPSMLHALGYGLLASTTLMDFCTRVQRYFRLLSQTARVDIVPGDEEVGAARGGVPGISGCLARHAVPDDAPAVRRCLSSDVVANVRARIVEQLPSEKCSQSTVAAALCMSSSTLRQRLTKRGTSFHELLNDIRRELACGYLRQAGVSVTEITFLLGFTDVSNFTRAFKRWTGVSPTRFRERG